MLEFVGCLLGALMFGFLLNAPKRTVLFSALIGLLGYGVYRGVFALFGSDLAGYFSATFLLTILSETAARRLREPATIFLCISIIPLVPGLGLYETMMRILEKDYLGVLESGTNVILIIVSICTAIALATQAFRLFARQR